MPGKLNSIPGTDMVREYFFPQATLTEYSTYPKDSKLINFKIVFQWFLLIKIIFCVFISDLSYSTWIISIASTQSTVAVLQIHMF